MEFAWEKLCGSIVQTWVYDVWWAQLSPDHGFPAQVGAACGSAHLNACVICVRLHLCTTFGAQLSPFQAQVGATCSCCTLRITDRDMCAVMKEAPQATLATYLNELWCHRAMVLFRRLRTRVEIDAYAPSSVK